MYVINELDAVHWKIEFQEVVEANYLKLPDTEKKMDCSSSGGKKYYPLV